MRILDSRRLTGPNMAMPEPGVIAEVKLERSCVSPDGGEGTAEDAAEAGEAWRKEVLALAAAVPISVEKLRVRPFAGGLALSFAAPFDLLLAASDLNDLAIARATAQLAGKSEIPLEEALAPIREAVAKQKNPKLLELKTGCDRRDLPLLCDDSELSIGMGQHSRTWPLTALPEIAEVPWSELARIPVALITGTNGKTTSARLLAHVCEGAGERTGLAATDYVSIAGEIIERGDFTGPAAARMVLRDRRVELAVLETARGGILRRGLALDRADCALITNLADDHLGEYGIDTVQALAQAKAVVARAVGANGRVVLNADDAESLTLYRSTPAHFIAPVIWFSLDANSEPAKPILAHHLYRGGEAFLLENGELVRQVGHQRTSLLLAREVPISFGGAALYNLANALAVAALAFALGFSQEEIVRGLKSFKPDAKNNPGRGNLLEGPRGVRVLLDFGHNAAGVHQVSGLIAALRRQRTSALTLLAACAGDRSDRNLEELSRELAATLPRRVFLRDLPGYLRGRQPGEVPAKLSELLARFGVPREAIAIEASEVESLRRALDAADDDELIVALVHLESEAVSALLEERGFH